MIALLAQVLTLLVVGLIPAIILIGILAAVPATWLMGCVVFRRTAKSNFAQNNSIPTP